MTKRKTKRVCVGWGIVMYPRDVHPYLYFGGPSGWGTRNDAIEAFDKQPGGNYSESRRKGKVIAKQLWVEVKE